MRLAHGEQVTFLKPGRSYDPYSGDEIDDWTTPETVATVAAGVEPVGSTEPASLDRQAIITGYRLWIGDLLDVDPRWRIQVRGRVARIEGHPAHWYQPMTGWQAGTILETRFVDG